MDTQNTVTAQAGRPDSATDARRPATDTAQGGSGFASVLDSVQDTAPAKTPQDSLKPSPYTVRSGDSLSAIAQQLARQRGVLVGPSESYRLALGLAAHNQIRNPDRIQPGQQLQLDGLHAALDGATQARPLTATPPPATPTAQTANSAPSTQDWLAHRVSPTALRASAQASPGTAVAQTHTQGGKHPVLQQTLDRAVVRGFIPAQEKQAVQDKILQLAEKYRFAPDDFARMTLMESDGMNPRASNQRCHGIIQFCDGPNRGAAAVGYGQQPRAILGLSVYQQLHLVDSYFQDNGLGKQGAAKLDDLYLTVLQPAARQEKQAHTPLNIPGPQARDLHVGANTRQAITRQSIVQGLLKITQEKLSNVFGQVVGSKPEPTHIAQGPTAPQDLLR